MTVDEWLPGPAAARGPHLIEYFEALLTTCAELSAGRDWTQTAASERSLLDTLRDHVARQAPILGVYDFAAERIHQHLVAVLATFSDIDPLIGIVACARAVDDLWGDDLSAEWPAFLEQRGNRIDPGDIVLSARTDHIADLYPPGTAFAATRLRASNNPARTRRAALYQPHEGIPAVVVDRALDHVLAPLLASGRRRSPRRWVAASPNASSEEWDFESAPIRPRDPTRHIEAAIRVAKDAFDHDAAVVVLPEFSGYVDAVDRLRQLRPAHPTLIVAGSGHDTTGGGLRNVASTWVARPDGTIPADQPIRTLKRVPYEGALGTEPLTEVASAITVLISGPWRLAIGVCRDLCDPAIPDALAQLGVNLLIAPACSPKTTNLARGAESVAVDAGGFALVANGPPTFVRPDGTVTAVDTTIWCTPLDRTQPRLMASTGGAGLMLIDLAQHRLTPVPWH